jgi:hypothetical protein
MDQLKYIVKEVKMSPLQEYEMYCHFCGIGKKSIRAHSYEEAKKIIEDNEAIRFDKIVRFTKPCWVDETISRQRNEEVKQESHLSD